jgi:PEP-CTERM motif
MTIHSTCGKAARVFDTLLAPDTIFDFASGGVSEFEILGINPSGDASNGNAFVTRVSFIGDGTFNGSMTAVIPEPSTWAMTLLGFAGLGLGGYRASRRSGATTKTARFAIEAVGRQS